MSDYRSFITGSRAHGVPKDDSDIDLVVALHEKDYRTLWALAGEKGKLQFGNLNLVAFNLDKHEDAVRYEAWKKTNYELCEKKPVTHEEACLAYREAGAECQYSKKDKQNDNS